MTDRLDAITAAMHDGSFLSRDIEDTIGDVRWLVDEVRRLRDRGYNHNIELAEKLRLAEAERDAARAAVKAWEDKEASRGMCCWQMEQERDAAIAAQIAAQVEVGKWRSDFDAARAEAEHERMRLAACGVAAMGNTEAMVADRLTPEHPYYSASYGDVCRAVDREMAHRAEAARLRQRYAEAVACIDNMAAQVRIALESPASMGSEDIDALVKAEDIRDAWLASEAKARLT